MPQTFAAKNDKTETVTKNLTDEALNISIALKEMSFFSAYLNAFSMVCNASFLALQKGHKGEAHATTHIIALQRIISNILSNCGFFSLNK